MHDPWKEADPEINAGVGHEVVQEFIGTQVVDSDWFWGRFPLTPPERRQPSEALPASLPPMRPGRHRARRQLIRRWWL